MIKKCPNCRARYKEEIICYRCGFDYTLTLNCMNKSLFSELIPFKLKLQIKFPFVPTLSHTMRIK